MKPQTTTLPVFALTFSAISAGANLISESGLVIPKGTPGRILSWTSTGQLVIDFGHQPLFTLPVESKLILIGGQR